MISVLLVDDQRIVGAAVKKMLASEEDIDFHFCDDPRRALDVAREILPDVVLVDLVMPQMPGAELIQKLRRDNQTQDMPVIVLSASDDHMKKTEAYAYGADDYLVKIPDKFVLIERIRRLASLDLDSDTMAERRRGTIDGESSADHPGDLVLNVTPRLPYENLRRHPYFRSAPVATVAGKKIPTIGGVPLWAKLGSGGMATVFYGFHPRLQTEVAVKILHPSFAESKPYWIKRLFREARLAAQIQSPRLVSVLDVNQENNLFYMIMEYVNGQSAEQHVRQARRNGAIGLTEIQAISTAIAATEGLAAAHAKNVIHRDVKPDNILIPAAEKDDVALFGLAKLTDLGIAHIEESDENLTAEKSALGTPGYMAPEQFLDAPKVGPSADVFGMGATLFRMLAGQPPFEGKTPVQTAMASVHQPHRRLEKLRPGVASPIVAVCDRALAKSLDERFPNAFVLGDALQMCMNFLDGGGQDAEEVIEEIKSL